MFSATMTEDVEEIINSFYSNPEKVQIALSGTPLDNISQTKYAVPNYYTKENLLAHILKDTDEMRKVLRSQRLPKWAPVPSVVQEIDFNETLEQGSDNDTQ